MYRITSSIIAGQPERIREAFRRRGILDYCTAVSPRDQEPRDQVFVKADGTIVPSDSRVVADVARECGQAVAA